MVICTPCLLPVVKAGAVGLTGALTYSKVRDRKISKKAKKKNKRKKEKTARRKKKKSKKARSQSGGSGMTETLDEFGRDSNDAFKIHLKEQLQNKKECKKKLGLGVQIRSKKNQPVDENEVTHILNGCKYYDRCQPCDTYLKESKEAPTLSSPPPSRIKYLPPPVPIAARQLSMKKSNPRRSMLMTAMRNRTKTKKLRNRRRSKHLREAMNRKRKRKSHNRKLRRTRSASFGGGKIKYGIRKNKVIELYPHKIKTKIGRHNYKLLWKTTKNNISGKTFHGKFYNSKEEAMKNIKTTK